MKTWMKGTALGLAASLTLCGGVVLHAVVDLKSKVDLGTVRYEGSRSCFGCHEERYATWHQTYHRTMTQPASETSVVGDFSDRSHSFAGVTSHFRKRDGKFFIETENEAGTREEFEVVRTVGSHRYQQYVTRRGDRHVRLPLAWNIQEKSWFHLNGGFLDPDSAPFSQHYSLWDGNCIFCHNTRPDPGYDWKKETFSSRVAELGIACEACHGPGGLHVDKNASWLRRTLLKKTGWPDPTIVAPDRLPKDRQVQVCGRCHGQRLPNPPEKIRDLMSAGDPFVPGQDLNQYTTPLWRGARYGPVDFSARFWKDGTARLSAYEYQGLLQSKDYQKGNLTCFSCHEPHGGDPSGMIEPEKRGPKACAPCHGGITQNITAHTRHLAGSSGSNCYACHMPRTTFGLLMAHRTHRIQKPDPSRAWRFDMPEACTVCHVEKGLGWAAARMHDHFGGKERDASEPPPGRGEISEAVRALLAGDVVQRAIAICSLGSADIPGASPREKLWTVPWLLVALEETYPSLRGMAWRELRATLERAGAGEGLPDFDPQGTTQQREREISGLWAFWRGLEKTGIGNPGGVVLLDPDFMPDRARIRELRKQQDNSVVSIGE
ncbi:MAG: hypothetical protein DIJKHBIC_01868 [Thermoanaerobaculia bacterium]|nr:hypothetical protein [Thermoanaerobaculia bacterium]